MKKHTQLDYYNYDSQEPLYVSFSIALVLKALGFNYPCISKYNYCNGDHHILITLPSPTINEFINHNNELLAPNWYELYLWYLFNKNILPIHLKVIHLKDFLINYLSSEPEESYNISTWTPSFKRYAYLKLLEVPYDTMDMV
jgi:hypothetical protein